MYSRQRSFTRTVGPWICTAACLLPIGSSGLELREVKLSDEPEGDGFASIAYVAPEEKDSSYQVKGVLSLRFSAFEIGDNSVWEWRIAPGIVKNTLVDQEVNTRFLDAALAGSFGRPDSKTRWTPTISLRMDSDRITDTERLRLRADTGISDERIKSGGTRPFFDNWAIQWHPRIGGYFERETSGPSDGQPTTTGIFARADARLFPPDRFENTSLNAFYQARLDLHSSAPDGEHTTTLRKLGASYYFFDPQQEKGLQPRLTYEWARGSDPFINQPKQSYQQVLFEIHYKK